jgi:hypothetical protein
VVECDSWFHYNCQNLKHHHIEELQTLQLEFICIDCCTRWGHFQFQHSLQRLSLAASESMSSAALDWSPNVAIDAELKRQLPSVDVWNGGLSAIPPETAISWFDIKSCGSPNGVIVSAVLYLIFDFFWYCNYCPYFVNILS